MKGPFLSDLPACRRCPRLVRYLANLPPQKGRARADYRNAPVPGFGDPSARICLVGLAPGAHGANRTGRPFTGDGAGDFMYPLLHRAGLASKGKVEDAGDGLILHDLYISNAVKCAPPGNKPLPEEFSCCRPFLVRELSLLPHLQVIVALGQGAFNSILRIWRKEGAIERLTSYPFGHCAVFHPPGRPWLVASYHTSRYNVQTGRLTEAMFLSLLDRVKELAAGENG